MTKLFTIFSFTVIFLAGGVNHANAMYLLSALGTPDSVEVAQAIIEERAKNVADVEPAAGEKAEEEDKK